MHGWPRKVLPRLRDFASCLCNLGLNCLTHPVFAAVALALVLQFPRLQISRGAAEQLFVIVKKKSSMETAAKFVPNGLFNSEAAIGRAAEQEQE